MSFRKSQCEKIFGFDLWYMIPLQKKKETDSCLVFFVPMLYIYLLKDVWFFFVAVGRKQPYIRKNVNFESFIFNEWTLSSIIDLLSKQNGGEVQEQWLFYGIDF